MKSTTGNFREKFKNFSVVEKMPTEMLNNTRSFDPEIGRWLTQDPAGFVDGLNVYAYVNNNPVNLVDPYGLDEIVLTGSPNGTPGTFSVSGDGNGATPSHTFQTPFPRPTTLTPQSTTSTPQPSTINVYPDESQAPNIPVFPDGAPNLGGKENANSINNNGDVFSSTDPNNLPPPKDPWSLNTGTGTPGDNTPPWINPNSKDNVSGPTWKIILFHIMKLISKHFNPFNLPGF